MQISIYKKAIRFLLYSIDIYSKNAWVVPLKKKRGIATTNVFPTITDKSNSKPNKMWVDKGSEFYKISMISMVTK